MDTYKQLEKAVLTGNLDTAKLLVKQSGLEILNITDKYGRTVLYDAIIKGYADIVEELCLFGIDINHQDKTGKTPLHFAAIHKRFAIARDLIRYGANVNIRDENGNTPIFDAIFNSGGDPQIILLLKENGADYVSENNHGVSPKDLANVIANFDVSFIFS
jgi:ankyrin repeat protein